MGNSDVEEWVISSTVTPGDENGTENHVWDKDRILADWAEGIQIIQTNLSSSSTKARVEFIEGLVIPFVKDKSEFLPPPPSSFTAITRTEALPRSDGDPDVGDLHGFHSSLPAVY